MGLGWGWRGVESWRLWDGAGWGGWGGGVLLGRGGCPTDGYVGGYAGEYAGGYVGGYVGEYVGEYVDGRRTDGRGGCDVVGGHVDGWVVRELVW